MVVIGNGQIIAVGDSSPSADDATDFGSTVLGKVVTHTFTISNSGLGKLALTRLADGQPHRGK